ncbi:MAG: S1 family peptidase [Mycobacterium sp.]
MTPTARLCVCSAAAVLAALSFPGTAPAHADAASPPMPGIQIDDDNGRCTAGFAAQGNDGNYYLLTSGHCDEHDGSLWTYGDEESLGYISASEKGGEGLEERDAALVRLDPELGEPIGDIGGTYPVRDVLSVDAIEVGAPFCKIGAVTGETCGAVTDVGGNVIETSVFSLHGDSGSPGFIKNSDGTVSAVGILMSSPDGDDYTTYFTLVDPLLSKWGLTILS